MELLNRRREMGSHLPYDYEVEYLESTGTQYIDTEINASSTLLTTVVFSVDTNFNFYNHAWVFGAYIHPYSVKYCASLISNTQLRVPYSNSDFMNINVGTTIQYNKKYTLSYKFGAIYFNGNLIGTQSGVATEPLSIYLFGRNDARQGYQILTPLLKIHSTQMVDNGLIRDYIPVVKDNIGYMYDKISGRLFGNAGTGQFIVGPRITSGGG